MQAACSEAELIDRIKREGVARTARALGIDQRAVRRRRNRVEHATGQPVRRGYLEPQWLEMSVPDGVLLIGSDAHFWPGHVPTAWHFLLRFAKEQAPVGLILNGDVIDGAKISRHPPINWERRPEVADELAFVQERLGELQAACGATELVWTGGNHDLRFESRMAAVMPEYARVEGVHLKDHFDPAWKSCYAVCINDDLIVKHRFRGGAHATYNNTLHSGRSMITGHLHSLDVRSFTDYNGTRYAADCGMLADCYGPQFLYCEDNPRNWRSGFLVVTFTGGRMLRPEVVEVIGEGEAVFRGQIMQL